MPLTSNMGAPLSSHEEAKIQQRHHELVEACKSVPVTTDPIALCSLITDVIFAAQSLRTAISEAWYYANKRAWPNPPRVIPAKKAARVTKAIANAAVLKELDLTEAEILSVLEGLAPSPVNKETSK